MEEIEVKTVTKHILIGFQKSKNRLQRLLAKEPNNTALLLRLKRIGRCPYCGQLFKLGDLFIQMGKNRFHYNCYQKAFYDIDDNFSIEEQYLITYGSIPIHVEVKQ
ncbi:hypothetical protein [Saccharolobus sp.]|uniref:hypothetical protein n=1 Tax=Saccharolobus sp. TaxID=2100761 RepID=UPI00317D1DFB